MPRVLGGPTSYENLALACPHCNAYKWAHTNGIDPSSGDIAPLFNPRTHLWDEHFRWAEDDPDVLVGITSIGRATVSRLQINEVGMVTVRRLLRELGISTR